MKKLLTLVALAAMTLSASAQGIEIYNGDKLIETFTNSNTSTYSVKLTKTPGTPECTQYVNSVSVSGSVNKLFTQGTTETTYPKTTTLTATLSPLNASNTTVTWASDNTAAATVDQNGVVTSGSTAGIANITATSEYTYYGTIVGTYTIYVTSSNAEVESITLNASAVNLYTKGETVQLTATALPIYAYNRNVTWSVSPNDGSVATVSSDGLVTAVATGTAYITATAADESGKTATCTVTVNIGGTDSNLLTGEFSVGSSKKVKFTKGNLYWNGSAWALETNQTGYPTSWDATHVGHFFWTNSTDYQSGNADYMPYASSYNYGAQATNDEFFCGEDNKINVNGTIGLYALTAVEWDYLINQRDNASSLYKYGVTVGSAPYCLIIAPDDYTGSIAESYSSESDLPAGLVCLPAAGYLDNSGLKDGGKSGYYWSATPFEYSGSAAHELTLDENGVSTGRMGGRSNGYSVRLVK